LPRRTPEEAKRDLTDVTPRRLEDSVAGSAGGPAYRPLVGSCAELGGALWSCGVVYYYYGLQRASFAWV